MTEYIEFYVSVDVEATGPIPGSYSMSSIGAFVAGARKKDGDYVLFDHKDRKNVFYSELKPISDKYIPEAIKVGVLDGFDSTIPDPDGSRRFEWMVEHGADPADAMNSFNKFVKDFGKSLGARPVFMGYPAGFDWMFTYWYFVEFVGSSPFGFSSVIDMKTAFAVGADSPLVRSVKRNMPKDLFADDVPHTHKADEDAIGQGIMGMKMLSHIRSLQKMGS